MKVSFVKAIESQDCGKGKNLINSLPNDKILDKCKLKAFADDKGDPNGKICSG